MGNVGGLLQAERTIRWIDSRLSWLETRAGLLVFFRDVIEFWPFSFQNHQDNSWRRVCPEDIGEVVVLVPQEIVCRSMKLFCFFFV